LNKYVFPVDTFRGLSGTLWGCAEDELSQRREFLREPMTAPWKNRKHTGEVNDRCQDREFQRYLQHKEYLAYMGAILAGGQVKFCFRRDGLPIIAAMLRKRPMHRTPPSSLRPEASVPRCRSCRFLSENPDLSQRGDCNQHARCSCPFRRQDSH